MKTMAIDEEERTLQELRRTNFQAWIERHGGVARVSERIGMAQSQIRDTLAGRKSFGEKVARRIEKAAKQADMGELDLDRNDQADSASPSKIAGWPPSFGSKSDFDDLTYDHRRDIAIWIRGRVAELKKQELNIAPKKRRSGRARS